MKKMILALALALSAAGGFAVVANRGGDPSGICCSDPYPPPDCPPGTTCK